MHVPAAPPGTVDALACDYARLVLDHDPASATQLGMHERDGELPPPSVARLEAHERDLRALRARVEAFDADGIDADVDRRGLLAIIDAQLAGFVLDRPWARNPLWWALGPTQAIFVPLMREHLPEAHRHAAITGRCAAVPAYLDAARELIEPVTVPPEWIALGRASAVAGASFLRDTIATVVPDAADAAVQAAASLEAFAAWLDDKVAPVAAGSYPVGEHALATMLREVHLLDETPQEVAERGRVLLDRCEAALVEAAGDEDWQSALERTRGVHPSMDELVPAYRRELERLQTFCFDHDLVTDPHAPATLKATPPFLRPLMGFAAYMAPGPFDEVRTGELWVTPPPATEGLGDHSYAMIQPITAHEGYPGHHLQLTTVAASESVARKLRGGTSLMVEGWGLYTEELMHETGYYTPEARLAQLSLSAMRAARIVADMQLHTGEASVDEAVDLLVQRANISRTTATSEVLRYTMMPTQPFTYLYGAEEIRRIRAAWRDKTGGSLRDFHDALLSYGHLPPALVAEALLA